MQNLAGHRDADTIVVDELTRCGIEVVKGEPSTGEVPTCHTGRLGGFTFTRAWYYWCVDGKMPLDAAIRLYSTPVGKRDIRAGGDCGCPDPATYYGTRYFHPSGKAVMDRETWEREQKSVATISEHFHEFEAEFNAKWMPDDDPKQYPGFVESYHVDSELGLYLLAEEIRKLPT